MDNLTIFCTDLSELNCNIHFNLILNGNNCLYTFLSWCNFKFWLDFLKKSQDILYLQGVCFSFAGRKA